MPKQSLKLRKNKVLALDYGVRRIGVASGDVDFKIAFPRGIILNKSLDFVIGEISLLVKELDVSLIVVGFPLNMEGNSWNILMKKAKSFSEKLKEKLPSVEIILFDERLSSFEADQIIKKALSAGAKKLHKIQNDAYAAQIILQRFFDK